MSNDFIFISETKRIFPGAAKWQQVGGAYIASAQGIDVSEA